jgi:hypothetical protein
MSQVGALPIVIVCLPNPGIIVRQRQSRVERREQEAE